MSIAWGVLGHTTRSHRPEPVLAPTPHIAHIDPLATQSWPVILACFMRALMSMAS